MKTAQDHITIRRQRHHAALETLANLPAGEGVKLWRRLRKIELLATAAHDHYCSSPKPFTVPGNGMVASRSYDFAGDENAMEAFHTREIVPAVARAFKGKIPAGFYLNQDPRGYSLKIDKNKGGFIPAGLETDWGGYGLLAPEIN
jgi:uncharacterized protein YodC (DUF2158 family)